MAEKEIKQEELNKVVGGAEDFSLQKHAGTYRVYVTLMWLDTGKTEVEEIYTGSQDYEDGLKVMRNALEQLQEVCERRHCIIQKSELVRTIYDD